jgi:hypothetical protein
LNLSDVYNDGSMYDHLVAFYTTENGWRHGKYIGYYCYNDYTHAMIYKQIFNMGHRIVSTTEKMDKTGAENYFAYRLQKMEKSKRQKDKFTNLTNVGQSLPFATKRMCSIG